MSVETIVTGVAFLAGVLAIMATVLRSNGKLEQRLGARIDELDSKIEGVDQKLSARIDNVERKLSARIDNIEQKLSAKIDDVEQKLGARIDGLDAKIDDVERKLGARIDRLDAKVDEHYREFTEFRLETKEAFGRIEVQLGRQDERLALWERFIWARTAPEFAGIPPELDRAEPPAHPAAG